MLTFEIQNEHLNPAVIDIFELRHRQIGRVVEFKYKSHVKNHLASSQLMVGQFVQTVLGDEILMCLGGDCDSFDMIESGKVRLLMPRERLVIVSTVPDDDRFRYAVEVSDGVGPAKYIDTGSNDGPAAQSALRDVSGWERFAGCSFRVVRCQLPWKSAEKPTLLD